MAPAEVRARLVMLESMGLDAERRDPDRSGQRLSKLGSISPVGTYDVYEPVPVVRLDGDWSGLRACVG